MSEKDARLNAAVALLKRADVLLARSVRYRKVLEEIKRAHEHVWNIHGSPCWICEAIRAATEEE